MRATIPLAAATIAGVVGCAAGFRGGVGPTVDTDGRVGVQAVISGFSGIAQHNGHQALVVDVGGGAQLDDRTALVTTAFGFDVGYRGKPVLMRAGVRTRLEGALADDVPSRWGGSLVGAMGLVLRQRPGPNKRFEAWILEVEVNASGLVDENSNQEFGDVRGYFFVPVVIGKLASAPYPTAKPPPEDHPSQPVPTPTSQPAPAAPRPTAEPKAKPSIGEAQLVGSWRTEYADFEEIALNADGTFSTFMHARPFNDGRWRLTKAAGTSSLTLLREGETYLAFTAIDLDGDELRGSIGKVIATWTRIAPNSPSPSRDDE